MEGSGEADAKVDLIPVKFNVARQFRGYLRFDNISQSRVGSILLCGSGSCC